MFDQTQWRRDRRDRFGAAAVARDQNRRVPCAHDSRASGRGIDGDAHSCHKRARAKNAAKIVVHRFHHPSGSIVLDAAMMEKKFRQGGKQRCSGPVAGTIGNPKQDPAIFHPQPAIDIAAYLDHRSITGGDFPACNGGWLLRNQGLLSQLCRSKIALQIATPFFKLVILPLQLAPHRAQPKLSLNSRPQHCSVDRLGHKIVRPGLKQRTSLSSLPCPVNMIAGICAIAGSLSERRVLSTSVPFSPGISKSRRRSEGRLACTSANASAPSSHSWHW